MVKVETRTVPKILEEYCNSCNKPTTTIKELRVGPRENSMALTRMCPKCYLELLQAMKEG